MLRTQVLMRGDVKTMRTLEEWSARAGNSEPALVMIEEYMELRERELFDTEGTSAGVPWAADEPTTIAAKQDRSGAGKILEDSGALKRSLTERSDENAIREIGPGWLRFGTSLRYAAILARTHLTRGGRDTVPARKPIHWTLRDRYVITKMMGDWISGRVTKHIRPSIRTYRGPFL